MLIYYRLDRDRLPRLLRLVLRSDELSLPIDKMLAVLLRKLD